MQAKDRQHLRDEVARRIMGWTVGSIPWAYSDEAELWHGEDGTPLIPRHAWRPDEDDRQLMQVLDHMVERGFCCQLGITDDGASARFSRPGSDAVIASDDADRRLAVLTAGLAATD